MPNVKISNLRGPAGGQGAAGATGAQGPPGTAGTPGTPGTNGANAWTLTAADFTVPPVGSSILVNVQDASWAVVGEFVWVTGAGGSPSSSLAMQVTAKTATTLTLLNPPTAGMQASGDTGNLLSVGSDSLLYLPPSAIQPTITSVRLRSFNAVGNPTMECDQRNCFAGITNIASGTFALDRWIIQKNGTMQANLVAGVQDLVLVPGTSYCISRIPLAIGIATSQSSLAAGDYFRLMQIIDGTLWRELCSDVTSFSLLVKSDVANIKFSVALMSFDQTVTLTKLCTVPSAATWTLISLPSLPKPTSGSFPMTPGSAAAYLSITLAAGTTYIAPAADTWQNGAFMSAPGSGNFFANSVGNGFRIAFVQHEPGPLCTTLIDKPFTQNLDECLRYFTKSYNYAVKPGTYNGAGMFNGYVIAGGHPWLLVPFKKIMAKTPTVTGYSGGPSGAVNTVYDATAAGDRAISGPASPGEAGFSGFTIATTNAAAAQYQFHYTADTGW